MLRSSFRRLLALDDPPERTALAFSVGVFIAFSPLLGLHTILATILAFLFRFNKLAIYAGTFVNNPFLTLVPIIVVSYAVGALLLGRPLSLPAEGVALLRDPLLGQMPTALNLFAVVLTGLIGWAITFPFFARFRGRVAYWL